jgi:L-iditol 2-dehydrogenase
MLGITKLSNSDGDMDLRQRERRRPRPGYVLLEVTGAGICGTDIHILKGEYKVVPPVTVGHEVCGIVCEVGDGVDHGLVGRRVVSETFFSTCRRCEYCRNGRPNMCAQRKSIGTHVDGAMAPFVEVPDFGLHPVPEWLSDAASSMSEPVACVMNSMAGQDAYVGPDNDVLVIGPGAIGLIAAQVAVGCGAKVMVRGTDKDRARLDVAAKIGLTVCDTSTALPEAGYDRVIECSGAAPGVADALRTLRKGGHLVQMGIIGKDAQLPFDLICYKELTVTAGFASTPRSWGRAMRLIWDKKVALEPLVSDVAPLQDWSALFKRSISGHGLKFVFDPRLKPAV